MGRKSRRAVYDPSIMDRADSLHGGSGHDSDDDAATDPSSPDPLLSPPDTDGAFPGDAVTHNSSSTFIFQEQQETQEILDPRLHKIQSVRREKENSKCRRNFLVTLLLIGLVAIIVTVSVVVAKNNQKAADEAAAANKNKATSARVYLEPKPAGLMEVCKESKTNPELLLQCEEGCEKSECCDLPSNFELSCLKGNEATCLDYHTACHVLDGVGTVETPVQVAPTDLALTCSINNLLTDSGIQQCSKQCYPHHCCYEPGVPSCTEHPNCVGYAPCLNLRAAKTMHSAIVDQINFECQRNKIVSSRIGRLECKNTCKLGACCFVGNKKCRKKPSNYCVQYQGCEILHDGSLPELPVEEPDDDYDEDDYDDDDYDMDDDFIDDEDDDFYDDIDAEPLSDEDDEDLGGGYDARNPDEDIESEGMSDGDEDEDEDDVEPEDMSDGELEEDDDYDDGGDSAWDVPHPVLDPIPAEITSVCAPAAVQGSNVQGSLDDKQKCAVICAKAECCNFPERLPQSCLVDNHLTCLQYHKSCANLEGITPSIAQDVTIPLAPNNLPDVCSVDSIATPVGLTECADICEPAKCCYEVTSSHCRDHANCDGYATCFNLRAGIEDNANIAAVVNAACTTKAVKTVAGRAKCNQLCVQQRCCLRGAETCSHKSQPICNQYTACERLYNDNETPVNTGHAVLDLPSADLAAICLEADIDAGNMAECKETCSKFGCCNIPENFAASCLKGNHDKCLQVHQECSILEVGTATLAPNAIILNPAPSSLIDFCSFDSLATGGGTKRCQDACTPAKCCFSTDISNGESCRNFVQCKGYAPCLNLEASKEITQEIQVEVASKCTSEKVKNAPGRAVCLSVCQQHRCCWEAAVNPTLALNCHEEPCSQYLGCMVLNTPANDVTGGNNNTPTNPATGDTVNTPVNPTTGGDNNTLAQP